MKDTLLAWAELFKAMNWKDWTAIGGILLLLTAVLQGTTGVDVFGSLGTGLASVGDLVVQIVRAIRGAV